MSHTEARSYVRSTADSPLSDLTIAALLAETAAQFPDKLAVVFREQGARWSWQEFANEIEAFAAGLQELGLRKGDRVGIWSPNRVEWLVTQFATAQLGLILVNINPAYRLAELEYTLRVSGCRAVVSAQEMRTSKYLEMLQTVRPQLPRLEWIIRMGEGRTPNMLNYADLLAKGRGGTIREEPLDCHDPINIQFTSGTTGSPKGATLTHHNVVNNARFIAQALNFSEADRLCIPVPLYHCFGMVLSVLACVSTGATMVFPGEMFDPAVVLAAVSEERCTALHGVPTMFIAELAHPDFKTFDLSSLRTGIMAGSPCPIETMRQVVSEMNMSEVTIAYGMTETSPVSFQSSTADPLERRVTTVGRIQPRLEAKVIDKSGQIVPRGETGELCVRGYSVMRGYWEDPVRTGEVIKDGWMHSGDLAIIDDEGYCNIVVDDREVTGVHPSILDDLPRPHRIIPIAAHDGIARTYFACLSARNDLAAPVDHLRFKASLNNPRPLLHVVPAGRPSSSGRTPATSPSCRRRWSPRSCSFRRPPAASFRWGMANRP